jgi:hypothetical protein
MMKTIDEGSSRHSNTQTRYKIEATKEMKKKVGKMQRTYPAQLLDFRRVLGSQRHHGPACIYAFG